MNSKDRAAKIIDKIGERAREQWGDYWQAELVKAYCLIESEESGKLVKPVARRSQILRVFQTQATTLETVIRLGEAVGLAIGAETLIELY
jgi:hypothetical protein